MRFIPENPKQFGPLRNAFRISPSRDGSVQLRLEGIDTPETHYGRGAQPLGNEARDELLRAVGFKNVKIAGPSSQKVVSAEPKGGVKGWILSKGADTHGRPISYVLTGTPTPNTAGDEWVHLNAELLKKTLNFHMVEHGHAYFTVYTSTPASHRLALQEVAASARDRKVGVWGTDSTAEFTLEGQNSIGPQGQLILPKLFRRCTDYLKAVADGFRGNLTEWMEANTSTSRQENDQVIVGGALEVRFSSLIEQRNSKIHLKADLLDLVFVEKA